MIRWSASAVVCALVVLGGCAGPQPALVEVAQPTASPSDAVLAPDGAEGAPEEFAFLDDTPVAVPSPSSGPAVRIGLVGFAPADPLKVSVVEPAHMLLLDVLYDGLTEWDTATGGWRFGLADDVDTSEDGLVWTFSLGDHEFSNGKPVLASDVVRSLERWSEAGDSLPAGRLDVIEGLDARGDDTVVITLRRPFALLPGLLSSPVYGVVPTGDLNGRQGSGSAFVSAGGVGLETVHFASSTAALDAFARKEIDVVYVDTTYEGDVDVVVDATVETYLVANADSAPLADAVRRRELFASVDTRPVARAGYGDAATPIRRLDGDPGGCGDLCGGSGLVDGVGSLALSYVGARDDHETVMAEVIAGQMQAGGASQVTLRSYAVGELADEIAAGEHQLVRWGWVGLFPSDDSRLSPFQSQSADNIAGYQSKAFDAALAKAQLSGSPELYAKAREVLEADAVVLGLARLQIRAKVSPAIRELGLRHDGSIDLAALTLSGS